MEQSNKIAVSVIIPAYNRADLIGRAIRSALNQTYQNFEIIVVDDASTDKTEEAVLSFGDKKIKYIKHKINKGGSSARNTGIESAQGEYIAFLDSDDEWLPEKLEKQIEKIKNSNNKIGVIYTGYWLIAAGQKKKLGIIPQKREDIFYHQLFTDNVSPTSAVLVKKECLEKVGFFDETLSARQDYDMWLRISEHYYFDYLREPLVNIYFHQQHRISSSGLENQISAELRIIEKVKQKIAAYSEIARKNIISEHYYRLGKCCMVNNSATKGRNFFIKAIKIYPFRVKYFMLFCISLSGCKLYNNFSNFNKSIKTIIYKFLK